MIPDLPPSLILPDHYQGNRPAIIRPAADILPPSVGELLKRGEQKKGTIPFGAFGAGKTDISYLNGWTVGSPETSIHTRTGVALGPETAGKSIFLGLTYDYANGRQCNSVSIAGVAAVRLGRAATVSSVANAELWVAHGVTATSGNIVVTMNGATYGCSGAVYKGLNASALTVLNSAVVVSDTAAISSGVSLTCAPGNWLFAINRLAGPRTLTWSGISTVDFDGDGYQGFASERPATSGTRTITCTYNSIAQYRRLYLAALG